MLKSTLYILIVSFFLCVFASAQSLQGKSQILIAYESRSAFVGNVISIGEKPKGFSTSGLWAQTAVFEVKKLLRGQIKSKFVAVSVAVTRDLRLSMFEKGDYVVFLSEYSGNGDSDSCGNYELNPTRTKLKVLDDANRSSEIPCYQIDELSNFVAGTKEEIEAITDYLKFLEK